MTFFDSVDEDRPDLQKIKPFHTLPNREQDVLKWLQEVTETLQKQALSRTLIQRHNLATYRGIQYDTKRTTNRDSERIYRSTRIDKFAVNHLHDMVETKVSQMMRIKPAVEVLPTNDEFADKNAAKATKMLINHLFYINNIDYLLENLHRHARIFGETYLFETWDKDKGDLHPDYIAARDAGEQLDLISENGEKVGIIDKPVFTGDVQLEIELPWRVLLQRKPKLQEVEYCFRISVKNIDDLKKDYPNKQMQIKADKDLKFYDVDDMTDRSLGDETVIFEFFHKKTKYLPEGRYIKFTRSTILENKKYPYSHGELPFCRLTDLDSPDALNGVSRFEMVKPIQNMHNNLSTLLAKNIYLTGHAKWIMPRGACDIKQLGNENTIVQYQGPVPPQLVNVNSNPPEAFAYRDSLKDEMGTIYGVHGTSRGEPPQGVTAGVALQFLNEQENERATSDIVKHNNFIKEMARKMISVCGDYYMPDDGRMLRIVGKDNAYTIRHFDAANLSKDYDIRVQNGSALPESKAGKIQRIVELMQYKPDLLSSERWVDLLELGNTEKMQSLITEAVKASDSENEDLLAGNPVGAPEEWEDHIIHWRSHTKIIQRRSFKEETPAEIQQEMIEHIADTEFAMIEKAKENPLFEAQLAQLAQFPVFYRDGFKPTSREHQEMIVQGSANKGEQIVGNVPAQEPESLPGEDINLNSGRNK